MIEVLSKARCTDCNICVRICPTNVFDRGRDGTPTIARQEDCQTCFQCEAYCPEAALYVSPLRGPAPADSPFRDEAALLAAGSLGLYRTRIGWNKADVPRLPSEESFANLMGSVRARVLPVAVESAPIGAQKDVSTVSLFSPLRLGELELPNRVIMAPLGRARSHPDTREPSPSVVTYYRQRASAGLIISEATHVSADSVSRPGTPAIHSEGQVLAWRRVTEAVHEAGGRIFQQLFHLGRKADPARLPRSGLPVAPSAIPALGEYSSTDGPRPFPVPRALTLEEIPQLVDAFAQGARNAQRAGFDGVEIHGANGFLIDQFLRDGANQRNDSYGASLEGRARFLLEAVEAAIGVFGTGRVGVRVSPHATQDGTSDSAPHATYGYLATQLSARGIAYLHLIEPASTPHEARLGPTLRRTFQGPLVVCGGFDRETASRAVSQESADAIAFGVGYIANPDLVERLRRDAPWNQPDAATFYSGGDRGYIDYPSLDSQAAR